MDSIEQLLMSLPKSTLSPERDRRIREAILSAPVPTPPERVRWSFRVPRFAFAFASILVAVIGIGGYAYAAPTVTRGDALYVVKRGIEQVSARQPRAPVDRVRLHTTFALRRAAELEVLVTERENAERFVLVPIAHAAADGTETNGDDPVSATAADLVAETNAAVRVAETITEIAAARRAVQVIAEGQERVQRRLVRAARTAGVGNPRRAEALAQAMVVVQETAIASRAVAAETAVAVARGDLSVRVVIAPKREPPRASADPEKLSEELADERSELPALRSTLADAGATNADADAFIVQIEEKLDRADAAIRAGEDGQASGALHAAEALRKHAKHFVKVAEHEASERGEAEDALAAAHGALDELTGRVEILQDIQPEHRMVRAATALLETARAKLAEADASFAVGADARARAQAEVAQELLKRLEARLGGWEEAWPEPADADESDVPRDADDGASGDETGGGTDVEVEILDEDEPAEEVEGRMMKDANIPESMRAEMEERMEREAAKKKEEIETPREREERGVDPKERTLRRGRVRGSVEVWDEAAGSSATIDPQTGLRYEFKDEYLRPPAW